MSRRSGAAVRQSNAASKGKGNKEKAEKPALKKTLLVQKWKGFESTNPNALPPIEFGTLGESVANKEKVHIAMDKASGNWHKVHVQKFRDNSKKARFKAKYECQVLWIDWPGNGGWITYSEECLVPYIDMAKQGFVQQPLSDDPPSAIIYRREGDEKEDNAYVVESIVSTRIPKGSNKRGAKVMGEKDREWEVKWKGWDAKDNTFESLNAFLSNDGISASLVEFELDRSGLIPCISHIDTWTTVIGWAQEMVAQGKNFVGGNEFTMIKFRSPSGRVIIEPEEDESEFSETDEGEGGSFKRPQRKSKRRSDGSPKKSAASSASSLSAAATAAAAAAAGAAKEAATAATAATAAPVTAETALPRKGARASKRHAASTADADAAGPATEGGVEKRAVDNVDDQPRRGGGTKTKKGKKKQAVLNDEKTEQQGQQGTQQRRQQRKQQQERQEQHTEAGEDDGTAILSPTKFARVETAAGGSERTATQPASQHVANPPVPVAAVQAGANALPDVTAAHGTAVAVAAVSAAAAHSAAVATVAAASKAEDVAPTNTKLYVARHAERVDRAMEKIGKDWISGAARPHDPPLSAHGQNQAKALGKHIASNPHSKLPTRIIASPLIRTVQTASLVAEMLGLGPASVWIEEGLCEEAKSMRYPAPPYLLKTMDLMGFSSLINVAAKSVRPVLHVKDGSTRVRDLRRNAKKLKAGKNEHEIHYVREHHNTLPTPVMAMDDLLDASFVSALDTITQSRVRECLDLILSDPRHSGETLMLVMHGASSKAAVKYLSGGAVVTTTVCSYAAFDCKKRANSGGGGAGASAGTGAGYPSSNEGGWTLLTGKEKMQDDYLEGHGSSVGAEGAGDAG